MRILKLSVVLAVVASLFSFSGPKKNNDSIPESVSKKITKGTFDTQLAGACFATKRKPEKIKKMT